MGLRVSIVSLGCPKNEVDSELILGRLVEEGFEFSSEIEGSDLVVLNTCAFIDSATAESLSWVRKLIELKKNGGVRRIAVVGCLPQKVGSKILRELEDVDFLAGVGYPQEVGSFLAKASKRGIKRAYFFKPLPDRWVERGPRFQFKKRFYAYLKIAEGCNNRCSYCVIPSIRGPYRSKPIDDVLMEAERFVNNGVKELILVSQDCTLYEYSLPLLIKKISEINGDFWIRVLYLHPVRISDELIDVLLLTDKVCSYFDIPIQHVDDGVLSLMRRPYGERQLRSLFNKLRTRDPLACLRTTVMVGFPGESRVSFDKLVDFVSEVRFDRLGSFIYSPQKGSLSYFLKPSPLRVSKRRRDFLMTLQRDISRERNELFVGRVLRVLVEKPRVGRSYRDAPEIDGVVYIDRKDIKPGNFVNVLVERAGEYDLWGKVIT